jgi:hypothetical protein
MVTKNKRKKMKKRFVLMGLLMGMLATVSSYADTINVQFENRTQYDFKLSGSSVHPDTGRPPQEIKALSTTDVFTMTGRSGAPGGRVFAIYKLPDSTGYWGDLDASFEWNQLGEMYPPGCVVQLSSTICVTEKRGNKYVMVIHYQSQKRK